MTAHTTKEGLEINVTGTGYAIRSSERAILVLQAQSDQVATPKEASAALASTTKAIRDVITPHCPQDKTTGRTYEGAPIAHYSTSTMDTSFHKERAAPDGTTFPTLYSARQEFHIKFADFDLLDSLAMELSSMKNVKIQKIDWRLTDATSESIHNIARKAAAKNAITKAHDYAEVFAGVKTEDLSEKVKAMDISERSYYNQSTTPQLHHGKGQRFVKREKELQFQPEDVRLEVQVTAKFVVK
ncbi:hypothetical protein BCR34DRAFT_555731 [Clohesyomyces aquaticus]|uniref:SIMPL domain-containing protein n=1 Tax=Clohesyomyces aquaticus TaxID=1231657 RepID=A0A1Y2A4L2_9PLEO|nr:hypothetical protein BCR34DRAFT_555731 [Clohesyomyces aquaticus]